MLEQHTGSPNVQRYLSVIKITQLHMVSCSDTDRYIYTNGLYSAVHVELAELPDIIS